MIKFKDILLNIAIVLLWFISTILIAITIEHRFLGFLPSIIALYVKLYLKRRKRILEFVKLNFEKIGYELIEERPLKLMEFFSFSNIVLKPTFFFNNVSISRLKYITTFMRIFKAKAKDGKYYELKTFVGQKWNDEIEIHIINKKKVS
ncbi:hypothetical protein SGQ44_18060 [Flavobacterium sp. Fl-77]|uniref:Uncharacterized protein n=1 Tax=Flavobacterium flavipigmentatum TaxID=2893884 RepID=A0AAJ2SCK3_9FLAO|nr:MULTISPECIES: hypothetical protein [unclassified Flavobacterium]MDX6184073.1 hypothetical protein [Flavobacterium sp. Fl-33]MDX6187667.1 hypothetical protein [Flavobacterium sp. Fl-77]UFH38408.1 hypothetical protein LNP22_16945 [Flavobacterium sp. F-70]